MSEPPVKDVTIFLKFLDPFIAVHLKESTSFRCKYAQCIFNLAMIDILDNTMDLKSQVRRHYRRYTNSERSLWAHPHRV